MWLVSLVIVLLLTTLCVMLGAHLVGARRKDFWICLVAVIVSALITGFALHRLHGVGLLLSVLLAALVYMLVLGTTYLRGLVVALIQYILPALLATALLALMFGGVMSGLHRMTHDAPFRLDLPALRI